MTRSEWNDAILRIEGGSGSGADVAACVAHIAAIALDPEASHVAEDDLFLAVLRAVANGDPSSRALAEEACKTSVLGLRRWYS